MLFLRHRPASIRASLLSAFLLIHSVFAFTVTISEKDELRQTCSGMIAGADSHIDAIFHKGSVGTVATMFHEFADFDKLGKDSNERDAFGFSLKSYICTAKAVQQSLCTREQLGNFIVDESKGKATTVQVQRLDFGAKGLEEEKTLVSTTHDHGFNGRERMLTPVQLLFSYGTTAIQRQRLWLLLLGCV